MKPLKSKQPSFTVFSFFQAQIDVVPYEMDIDPNTLILGGQVCLDFNVTVPCEFMLKLLELILLIFAFPLLQFLPLSFLTLYHKKIMQLPSIGQA